jgi:hypothetical protein
MTEGDNPHKASKRSALHLEDQDADRRQPPAPETEYIPGEEAGDAGEGSRGGPMKHQGVGPGDPHTDVPNRR